MSKREINIPIQRNADQHYRYKMPQIQSKRISSGNGIKTAILNGKSISDAIGRTMESITQWYSYSLGVQAKQGPKVNQIYLNGDHQQKVLLDKLYEYIDSFIICPACSNPETTYMLKDNHLHLHCNSCGNTTQIKTSKNAHFSKMENWIKASILKENSNQIKITNETIEKSTEIEFTNNNCYINTEELEEIAKKLDSNTNDKLTSKDQDDFFDNIKKMAKNENFTDEKIFIEIQNYRNKWNAEDRWLILVVFHALFEENPNEILNIIKKKRNLLILLLQNENDQKIFLSVLIQFISKTNPQLLSSAPIIFYTLYDNEVIENNGFKMWLKNPVKKLEGSKKVSENIRNAVLKKFIKWIDEAPYKEEEEEKNEEDVIEDIEIDNCIDIDSI